MTAANLTSGQQPQDALIVDTSTLLNSILKTASAPRKSSYEDCDDKIQEIVFGLIDKMPEFDHIKSARLRMLFKIGPWAKTGECSKTSGKWRHLTEYDFVLVFHKDSWDTFSESQREALIHHELSHIGRKDDKWFIIPHDVTEFFTTFKRYGDWNPALSQFAQIAVDNQVMK